MKAIENSRWTQHLARVILAMNIQRHNNLSYRISSYEVFFDRKHFQRLNNLATMTEQQNVNTNNFSDDAIDRHCAQKILNFAIKNSFIKNLEQKCEKEKIDDKNINDNNENECKNFV